MADLEVANPTRNGLQCLAREVGHDRDAVPAQVAGQPLVGVRWKHLVVGRPGQHRNPGGKTRHKRGIVEVVDFVAA